MFVEVADKIASLVRMNVSTGAWFEDANNIVYKDMLEVTAERAR